MTVHDAIAEAERILPGVAAPDGELDRSPAERLLASGRLTSTRRP
jgi:hypothetical protein